MEHDLETLFDIQKVINPHHNEYYIFCGGRGYGRTYTLGMYKLLQDISKCNKELEKLKGE